MVEPRFSQTEGKVCRQRYHTAGADYLSPQMIMKERVQGEKRLVKSSVVILSSGRALSHAVRSAAFLYRYDFSSNFCLQIAVGPLEVHLKQAAARLAWPVLGPSGCTHSQECGIPSADSLTADHCHVAGCVTPCSLCHCLLSLRAQ